MRQKFLLLSVVALIAVTFSSCEKEPDELNHYTTESSGPTPALEGFDQLVVNTPDAVVIDDANSFKFEWESGDIIAVYEVDGEWAANFKIADAATTVKSFQAMDEARLDDNKYYVALYPAPKSGEEGNYEDYMAAATLAGVTQKQDGTTCKHLKERCYMSVAFKGDDAITLNHASAFAAINFQVNAGETPTSLKFADGENNYTVNLANFAQAATDEDSYTAYLAIDPATAESRTQQIATITESGAKIHKIEDCTEIYSAGVSYTLSTFTVEEYSEVIVSMPEAISGDVSFAWADGDKISLYNATSGEWVADCSIADVAASKFSLDNEVVIDNKNSYIAVYPVRANSEATYEAYQISAKAQIAAQSQTGDNSSAHLKGECTLSGEFKGGDVATLSHQNAILKLIFAADAEPTALTFVDGVNSYELSLKGLSGATSCTTYLAVAPNATEAREQSVSIVCGAATQKFSTACSEVYSAGAIFAASTNDMVSASITQIGTAAELMAYLADPTSDAILTADIDLAGETAYLPTTYLAKELNGNGKKISNLTITIADGTDAALFKGMSNGGIIKNLTMENPKMTGLQYVGSFAGKLMEGATIIDCSVVGGEIETLNNIAGGIAGQSLGLIEGCSFEGTITAAKGNAGGIIGIGMKAADSTDPSYISTVKNCTVNAQITSKGENAAGVVAKSTSVHILDCTFSGSITGTKNVGGIAGFTFTTTIERCVNNGEITASSFNTGGIAANCDGAIVIAGCVNNGNITSKSNVVGGILGLSAISGDAKTEATSQVYGCSNNGNIEGINKVAGVVASFTNGGTLVACYNNGTITANSSSASTGKPVAGVLAEAKVNSTIVGCYSSGVSTSTLEGYTAPQAIATPVGTFTVTDCYYINTQALGVDKGTKCDDIAGINAKVEAMNTAINATVCSAYNYVAGAGAAVDAPTLKLK